ncbi:hypothetical protein PM082_013987 [Marasmius tenuissimus]|nr:hypothetical protein PM082_013987 [Marasmius tenuissimus]
MLQAKVRAFVDLRDGGDANGTAITGWEGDWNRESGTVSHQQWVFQRVSQSSDEVGKILRGSPHRIAQDFKSYQVDGEYIILPQGIWQSIWRGTKLNGHRRWRRQIFDCDDFAVVFKSAVAEWGYDNVRADNISILCGLMLGRARVPKEPGHAYNFTINDNYDRVVFFEPQLNTFQDDNNYDPLLGFF